MAMLAGASTLKLSRNLQSSRKARSSQRTSWSRAKRGLLHLRFENIGMKASALVKKRKATAASRLLAASTPAAEGMAGA